MPYKIVRNDIVKMETEAIVNTANGNVAVGTGCDYAIYTAAGFDELLAYRREHIGPKAESEAFITPGFGLRAKHIIHVVSPLYQDGSDQELSALHACYRNALALAKEHGIKSIAFPLISTGSFKFPKEQGLRIALDEISSFLFDNEMDIYIVVFDDQSTALSSKISHDLQEYIDKGWKSRYHGLAFTHAQDRATPEGDLSGG
ncbi:MAG: macro domain-containing protein [Bacteroidaceae bacterium]|nr:macro domain-containing protein [Bacteroidaceae bacterium]